MNKIKTITRKSLISILVDFIGEEVNVKIRGVQGHVTSFLTSVGLDYIALTCKGSDYPLYISIRNVVTITKYRGSE